MDAVYTDDLVLLTNIPEKPECLLHSLEQAAGVFDCYMNLDKVEFMCFKQKPLKLVDHLPYLGSNISFTESNVDIHIEKVWTTINRLLIICKSKFYDKIKWEFFSSCSHVSTNIWLHILDYNQVLGEKAI